MFSRSLAHKVKGKPNSKNSAKLVLRKHLKNLMPQFNMLNEDSFNRGMKIRPSLCSSLIQKTEHVAETRL